MVISLIGNVSLDGKGIECAYWLNGKLNSNRRLPIINDNYNDNNHGFKDMNFFKNMEANIKDNICSN